MNNIMTWTRKLRKHRGIALITVVTLLALATGLLLALFSITQTELKSTVATSDGSMSRLQADMAVNIVMGQIQKAVQQDNSTLTTNQRETWASQPGMIRQYRESGRLLSANKLYSNQEMVIKVAADNELQEFQALNKIRTDMPPTNWNEQVDQYVDMNEPVIKLIDDGTGTAVQQLVFPILDPRAYNTADVTKSVEGFSYSDKQDGLATGAELNGVILPDSVGDNLDEQRLPMPVQWLYVLKDGTLGHLDVNKNFVSPEGSAATELNPIVGRVAFWTDDESTKININTAGEGTAWNAPNLFHSRDGDWARFQPMANEYQRYPGHPATTCLSTVLFPGIPMNPLRVDPNSTSDANSAAFNKAFAIKEKIYEFMPKILPGGSKGGSVPVPVGRAFTEPQFSEVQAALKERLFASVDDFLLMPATNTDGTRDEIDFGANNNMWSGIPRSSVIERLRGFLTTNSRASELNPFGFPKVAMWPLHQTDSHEYRTVFDRTIARASSLPGNANFYYFTRNQPNATTELTGITRNLRLHNYLLTLTSQKIPGFGTSATSTFAAKYGFNHEQILVEIFDYIRSTNLYDDLIAEAAVGDNPSTSGWGTPNSRTTAFNTGVTGGLRSKTFTPVRNGKNEGSNGMSSYPGHGQVAPSKIQKTGTLHLRGMGRYFTISEVGLHFICTAEGLANSANQPIPGGRAAPKTPIISPTNDAMTGANYAPFSWTEGAWASTAGTKYNYWYSNFPPLSTANREPSTGFYKTRYPDTHMLEGIEGDNMEYPGYHPYYWNYTLDRDTPLPINTKRVQAMFLLEWFTPSAGWTLINPDFMIEVDASALQVNSPSAGLVRMFPYRNGRMVVRPFHNFASAWGVDQRGGATSFRAFLNGRRLPPFVLNTETGQRPSDNFFKRGTMPADATIPTGNEGAGTTGWSNYATQTGVLQEVNQYNLISDFFDIQTGGAERGEQAGVIDFRGGAVVIRILPNNLTGTSFSDTQANQVFNFAFPAATIPAPVLCITTQQPQEYQNSDGSWVIRRPVPPTYWWAFHADGAIGRNTNGTRAGDAQIGREHGGRFRYLGSEIGDWGRRYLSGPQYQDPMDEAGAFNSTQVPPKSGPLLRFRGSLAIAEDSIQSLVLRHGDPRLTMGQFIVPNTEFVPHRHYGNFDGTYKRMAHNITFGNRSDGPGYDRGYDVLQYRMVPGVTYNEGFVPDMPYRSEASGAMHKYGDFDRGIGNMADGPYINKPDEGNTYSINTTTGESAVPYFTDNWIAWTGGYSYFSPNRQVASPGKFGSLPTGVHDDTSSPGRKGKRREAWRTLLFRPSVWFYQEEPSNTAGNRHPGAPASLLLSHPTTGAPMTVNNFGDNPPDYLFMDFYWMPVVEPYAISEPGATMGKINMNYQMAPFRHIKRATGLYAVMKSELITALSSTNPPTGSSDAAVYLTRPGGAPANTSHTWFWRSGTNTTYGRRNWHRDIDVDATLKLFDDRFACGFIFISPAQICEMHLLPKRADSSDTAVPATWFAKMGNTGHLTNSSASSIHKFWQDHKLTAENLRERPYTNMYPRLTTKSNTYTVYVRSQVIKKARSMAPNQFDSSKDQVSAEYRSATVIERYLDLKDPTLNSTAGIDYAPSQTTQILTRPTLEEFHRFRVLSQKRID